MTKLLLLCVALSFAHYLAGPDSAWDVIIFCHDVMIVVLAAAVLKLLPYVNLPAKCTCLLFVLWRAWIMVVNSFQLDFASSRPFIFLEAVFFLVLAAWQFTKDVDIESAEYSLEGTFFLVSPPKEIFGLVLATAWLPFGNRMVVRSGFIYYVSLCRFRRKIFRESHLKGRVLVQVERPSAIDVDHLNELTNKTAVPLLRDCRQYEILLGSIRERIISDTDPRSTPLPR